MVRRLFSVIVFARFQSISPGLRAVHENRIKSNRLYVCARCLNLNQVALFVLGRLHAETCLGIIIHLSWFLCQTKEISCSDGYER